ncbi:hypothetical protein FRC02_004887 [Tulasnella sp. 418]|nr:hypothetical protein FRC02_004887 [Tulasnella sp. 418]
MANSTTTAKSAGKGKETARPLPQRQSESVAPVPDPTAAKKKKKKKGKNKANPGGGAEGVLQDDDDDGLPPLMQSYPHPTKNPPPSGIALSPDLESVHLSTTASLTASVGTPAELMNTAQDLYRRIDTDPLKISDDPDYWTTLPPTIRTFVQNAYAQGALNGAATDPERTQAMYSIAQQMITQGQLAVPRMTTTVGRGGTTTTTTTTTTVSGTGPYPPGALPFDTSIFSDPAFTQALEQLIPPTHHGTARFTTPAPGEHPLEEDYFSEEEEDEVEGDVNGMDGKTRTTTAQFTVSYGSNGVQQTTTQFTDSKGATIQRTTVRSPDLAMNLQQQDLTPNLASSKKNKKKKKKKTGVTAVATPNPAIPPTPVISPPTVRESVPIPIQSSAPPPPPPPSVNPPSRPANPPPPSSRAAGKQPMSYPTTTPQQPQQQPPTQRSQRAASKAPVNYAQQTPQPHHHQPSPPSSNASAPNKPRPPAQPKQSQNNRLWSTNSSEERERIKEFWLGLKESERKALVKVEKDMVLKKMKEQQKHSCSCAVCGRKKSAIEEELEVLYEAYYEELEQYAHQQQQSVSSGGAIPPPPGPGPFPGSVELDKNGAVVGGGVVPVAAKQHMQQIQTLEADEEEFDEDEEYEDDDGSDDAGSGAEDGGSDDEVQEGKMVRRQSAVRKGVGNGVNPAAMQKQQAAQQAAQRQDFFSFGSNFTAAGPGNILTVADDLLKNDGQKFLEMMEQLAEKRMGREAYAAEAIEDSDDGGSDVDGIGGMSDDGDADEDGDDDDEDEDEDDVILTEEQKTEEGRRMFSIFAARMFEQRVLQAYREKVAQERQLQLLRELEDEDRAEKDREAKKAKENQKKKDKKRLQKQMKDEEKARREAEKAAEEAAQKAKQEAHEEEMRKKREEERQKREAERKAREEEKMKKEEERRKRIAEEREKEAERKAAKEKERKKQKDREEKEAKEREKVEKAKAEKAEREAERLKEEAARREKEKEEREKEKEREREREKEKEKEKEKQANQAKAAAAKTATVSASSSISSPAIKNAVVKQPGTSQQQGKKAGAKTTATASNQPPSAASSSSGTTPSNKPQLPPITPAQVQTPSVASQRPPATPNQAVGPSNRRPGPQTPLPSPLQPIASAPHTPFPNGPPGMLYGPPSPVTPMPFSGPPQFAMPQGSPQVHVLQPSPLPRGFGSGGGPPGQLEFPTHGPPPPGTMPIGPGLRGIPSPGPNQLMSPPSLNGPVPGTGPISIAGTGFSPGAPMNSGHTRRVSLEPIGPKSAAVPAFGAITRPPQPIAPIGTRPGPVGPPSTASGSSGLNGTPSMGSSKLATDESEGGGSKASTSSSPLRSSPTPERLGSSALVDPEDEPLIPTGGRRAGVLGTVWGAPGPDLSSKSTDPISARPFGPWGSFSGRGPQLPPHPPGPHLPPPSTPWGPSPSLAPGAGPWSSSPAVGHPSAPFMGINGPGLGLPGGSNAISSGLPHGAGFPQTFGLPPFGTINGSSSGGPSGPGAGQPPTSPS